MKKVKGVIARTFNLRDQIFLFACCLSLMLTFNTLAVLTGPVYPAPGGNAWVNTGGISGASGLATWDYSSFDSNAFASLYFGLNQVDYGPLAAGLDGSALPMSFSGVSGTTATWSVLSPYTSAGGPGDPGSGIYPIEFRMTITGLGANPWVDPVPLGLPANLGAVADNSAGSDFTLNWEFVADMGSGFIPLNSVPQGPPGGQTRSSFASGFYYEVPEPTSLALLGFGGLLLARRRRD